jgi:hypothetical protein
MLLLDKNKVLSLASVRNHVVTNISNPEKITKGTITIKCSCGHVFTTTWKRYYSADNGCSNCKKIKITISNINKKKNIKSTTLVFSRPK